MKLYQFHLYDFQKTIAMCDDDLSFQRSEFHRSQVAGISPALQYNDMK